MVSHRFLPPMKAVIGSLPSGADWATEIKWDGMRLQVHVDGDDIRAYTGSGREVSANFPELAPLPGAIGTDVVLDAELVVFDGDHPSFARLQHRIHTRRPNAALLRDQPVVLIVFDLLALGEDLLLGLPYRHRRRLLLDLVDDGPSWRTPVHSEHEGHRLLALAAERSLEGVVAKRLDSPYRPGRRSRDWVKVKIRKRQEFVIGGWLEGSGGLRGSIGSLIVGVQAHPGGDGDGLRWAGSVGSGLTERFRTQLSHWLVEGPNPFADEVIAVDGTPHWVQPTVVAEIEYSLWSEGRQLWHPVFAGLRIDRDPLDVVREDVSEWAAADPSDDDSALD